MNTTRKEQLVIVGGGMAAGRLVTRLAEHAYDGEITLVCKEPIGPYNRVLLPDLVGASCAEESLAFHDPEWYANNSITLRTNFEVAEVNIKTREVRSRGGGTVSFDKLVLATGSNVSRPTVEGLALNGVTQLRTLEDADALQSLSNAPKRKVVVGGGLLGLETARALQLAGNQVDLIHRGEWLLNRQIDRRAAKYVHDFIESLGIRCHLGQSVASVHGRRRVEAVELTSGSVIVTRTVIFATGVQPNDRLASEAGLSVSDGVLVDAQLRASTEGVFAIGECARVTGRNFALVEPVYRQADALAMNLIGKAATFAAPATATRLKVAGLPVFAVGNPEFGATGEDVLIEDPARTIYRRLRFEDGRLTYAVLLGDTTGSRCMQECVTEGAKVGDPLALAFGQWKAAA